MVDKENLKCECGHVNPMGTDLCQICGNPFNEEEGQVINMRYEGAALRSKTYNKTIIDHIWNFFSSVKIGIWLMAITLVSSMLGTIFPQQLYIPSNAIPEVYYSEQFGSLGSIYVTLGLHNMYSSWWYVSLLVLIGISLVIVSLDRGLPLYRALNRQRVTRHASFLSRQRIYSTTEVASDQVLELAKGALKKRRYRIREEEAAIMGEKGRFSRWGSYVVHIGLIIFLIGTLIRILPGLSLEEYVFVRDGQTLPVPGTEEFYVKSEGFYLETYKNEDFPNLDKIIDEEVQIPREFRTEAILYEKIVDEDTGESDLVEVKRHSIVVNSPLEYKGLKLFQADYILNEFSEFTFTLTHKETLQPIGDIVIDLYDPERYYPLDDGYQVELFEYYPDFELGEDGKPRTKGSVPNQPSFIFIVTIPNQPEEERSWVFLGETVEMPGAENEYALKMKDVKFNSVTGLMVRKDVSLPVLAFGGFIVMIGLMLSFYWQHRRIWIQQDGGQVSIAAHTNKNWFGLKNEVEYVIDQAQLDMDKETLDKEVRE